MKVNSLIRREREIMTFNSQRDYLLLKTSGRHCRHRAIFYSTQSGTPLVN